MENFASATFIEVNLTVKKSTQSKLCSDNSNATLSQKYKEKILKSSYAVLREIIKEVLTQFCEFNVAQIPDYRKIL